MNAQRRHPLRIVWQLDEDSRFTVGSDEFIALAGGRTASMMGKPWVDIAAELSLDPDGGIARAIATRDTWSGLTISWPVGEGAGRLAIELSGLPVFDRERVFRGYRGFGVCRDLAQLSVLEAARQAGTACRDVPPLSKQGPAQKAASTAEEAPGAASNAADENVAAHLARGAEVIAPALTPGEHMAFREISRKLVEGLTALSVERDAGVAGPTPSEDKGALAHVHHLAETQSEAQPLLERIPVGILIYRLDRLLYANPTFLQWCGHSTLDGLIAAGGLDQLFIEPISAAVASRDQSLTLTVDRGTRVALKGELIGVDWGGEPAHALIAAPPDGEPGAKLESLRSEIAELKQNERELRESMRRAESASSAKSDFLAKISHEIRTPLNSIIGFSEVMMNEQFGSIGNERYREYLRDIHSSGAHLLSLINDLLDLSKIEAGKLPLTLSIVALNDLTAQCVATMGPQANRARILIRTALMPALPQIVADARSVRQIVLNVLSNSLKFTPAGGQVIVSTAVTEGGEVVLRVRDTGVGMTDKEIAAALEPFRQLATSPRGGTGLGLPLTKAMAEANRARFHLSSTPKEGTLVEIAFPAANAAAQLPS
jgi:signal transduction histidine kinase